MARKQAETTTEPTAGAPPATTGPTDLAQAASRSGPVSLGTVHDAFTYHAPTGDAEKAAYKAITEAGEYFARVILENTPRCADQTTAVRTVREARMWANAAIALGGRF